MFTSIIRNFSDSLRPPTQEAIEQERREQLETVKDLRRLLGGSEGLRVPLVLTRAN